MHLYSCIRGSDRERRKTWPRIKNGRRVETRGPRVTFRLTETLRAINGNAIEILSRSKNLSTVYTPTGCTPSRSPDANVPARTKRILAYNFGDFGVAVVLYLHAVFKPRRPVCSQKTPETRTLIPARARRNQCPGFSAPPVKSVRQRAEHLQFITEAIGGVTRFGCYSLVSRGRAKILESKIRKIRAVRGLSKFVDYTPQRLILSFILYKYTHSVQSPRFDTRAYQ